MNLKLRFKEYFIPALFSTIVLILGLIYHGEGSYYIDAENDFINSYIPHAEKFLQGRLVVDDFRGPVYIVVLALIKYITGSYFTAGIFISAVSGGLLLFFNYKILSDAAKERTAYYAMLLTAVNPYIIQYSYAPGTDMFAAALVSGGVYFFLSKRVLSSSALLCLAFLTRYNNGIVLIAVPAIILGGRYFSKNLDLRFQQSAVYIITAVIMLLPWAYYTWEKRGEVFYNENYKNVAVALIQEDKFSWEQSWNDVNGKYNSLTDVVMDDVAFTAGAVLENLIENFVRMVRKFNHALISVLFLLGLLYIPKFKMGRKLKIYVLINVLIFLSLSVVFFNVRFFLLLIPFYSLIIYKGMELVTGLYSVSISKNALRPIVLTAVLIISAFNSAAVNSLTLKSPPELIAAEKNKEELVSRLEGNSLASYHPHIPYILGLKWVPLPYKFPDGRTVAELKSAGADLLFVGKREREFRQLPGRIDPAEHPSLERAYKFKSGEAVIYIIR